MPRGKGIQWRAYKEITRLPVRGKDIEEFYVQVSAGVPAQGRAFVNVREFYTKDGVTLPGKKGFTIAVDEGEEFLEALKKGYDTLLEMVAELTPESGS